ncbi:hypothetical protein AAVH_20453 [Aphelenchoides avenae]|nr:hypothetical protein AAVH_20453 [Aphelenchus avenae]
MPLSGYILIESLHSLDRRQLDMCRRVGLHWKDIVDSKSATTLALHDISRFEIDWSCLNNDCVYIRKQWQFGCEIRDASGRRVFKRNALPKRDTESRSKNAPTCVRKFVFDAPDDGHDWLLDFLGQLENCNISGCFELPNLGLSHSVKLSMFEAASQQLGAKSFALRLEEEDFVNASAGQLWDHGTVRTAEQLKITVYAPGDVSTAEWLAVLRKLSACKYVSVMCSYQDGSIDEDIACRIVKLFEEDSSQLPEQCTLSFTCEFDDETPLPLNLPPAMALCSYLKEPVFDAGARDDMGKLDVEENIAKWRKDHDKVHKAVTFYRGLKTLSDIADAVADPEDNFGSLW